MTNDYYREFLAQIVREMIDNTKDAKIYSNTDFENGYLMGLYSMLKIVKTEVFLAEIDPAQVGLGDFDVDEWLRMGRAYWP